MVVAKHNTFDKFDPTDYYNVLEECGLEDYSDEEPLTAINTNMFGNYEANFSAFAITNFKPTIFGLERPRFSIDISAI